MGRWLSGSYRVPTDEPAQPESSEPPKAPANGASDE
jgi:endogenous inhibitor of DNA gyrase (YacG/DUF329 family)